MTRDKAPRFTQSYDVTVVPESPSSVEVGTFDLGEGHDTIWIKVTSAPSGGCPWPWAYGLLTWISDNGRELGTVKINGVCEGEVFRLGVGRPPLVRTGRLSFTPRSYNLAWVKLGHPWTLTFEAVSGVTNSGGGGQTVGAVVNSFVDTADNGLSLVRVNFG
jgi:hypothetical protein